MPPCVHKGAGPGRSQVEVEVVEHRTERSTALDQAHIHVRSLSIIIALCVESVWLQYKFMNYNAILWPAIDEWYAGILHWYSKYKSCFYRWTTLWQQADQLVERNVLLSSHHSQRHPLYAPCPPAPPSSSPRRLPGQTAAAGRPVLTSSHMRAWAPDGPDQPAASRS